MGAHYAESNFQKEEETLLIVVKIQISLIVDNVDNIKTKSIILNAEIVEVNFAQDVLCNNLFLFSLI